MLTTFFAGHEPDASKDALLVNSNNDISSTPTTTSRLVRTTSRLVQTTTTTRLDSSSPCVQRRCLLDDDASNDARLVLSRRVLSRLLDEHEHPLRRVSSSRPISRRPPRARVQRRCLLNDASNDARLVSSARSSPLVSTHLASARLLSSPRRDEDTRLVNTTRRGCSDARLVGSTTTRRPHVSSTRRGRSCPDDSGSSSTRRRRLSQDHADASVLARQLHDASNDRQR
jgi:hypothetical protein